MIDAIQRAREVLAAATPGEWREERPGSYGWIVAPGLPEPRGDICSGATPADAAAIVLAVRALPALLDLLEAAERVDHAYCDRALCDGPCAHRWCDLRRALDRALAALREAT